jgi:hypothetical protein
MFLRSSSIAARNRPPGTILSCWSSQATELTLRPEKQESASSMSPSLIWSKQALLNILPLGGATVG